MKPATFFSVYKFRIDRFGLSFRARMWVFMRFVNKNPIKNSFDLRFMINVHKI